MSDHVKMGLIVGASVIAATGLWIYFSEHQTCVRTYMDWHQLSRTHANRFCMQTRVARPN